MAIEIEIIRVLAKKSTKWIEKSEINDNHVDGEEENDDDDGEVADEMEW